jgi:hypothetical protein
MRETNTFAYYSRVLITEVKVLWYRLLDKVDQIKSFCRQVLNVFVVDTLFLSKLMTTKAFLPSFGKLVRSLHFIFFLTNRKLLSHGIIEDIIARHNDKSRSGF